MNWKEQDLIRLAAFIDGEGCISITKTKSKGSAKGFCFILRLDMINTDPRLIIWCKKTFGGRIYTAKDGRKETHRNRFIWCATGREVKKILVALLPHFLLKRNQAELALAFCETLNYKGGRVPEEIWILREQYWRELSDLKWINHDHDEISQYVN